MVDGVRLGGLQSLPKQIGAVFLSPPWGGVGYENIGPKKYDLKVIELAGDVNGEQLLAHATTAIPRGSGSISCFLPRNTNGIEVAKGALKAGLTGTMEMEQNYLNHKFKAITIYFDGTQDSKKEEDSSSAVSK